MSEFRTQKYVTERGMQVIQTLGYDDLGRTVEHVELSADGEPGLSLAAPIGRFPIGRSWYHQRPKAYPFT